MAENTIDSGGWRRNPWRIAGWSAVALALLLPLIAMQFTEEVSWTVGDFIFAALLMISVGLAFELAVTKTGDTAYRAAVGVALAAAFLLVWINGAVGILGSEDNVVNQLYLGVLAVGVFGAFLARFQPRGMALALFATALAQGTVAAVALAAGWGAPESGPVEVVALNGFFIALFVGSAMLFRQAARGRSEPGAA